MAIYLDANILIPWMPLAHLERVAVSIVAARLGQTIVVPAMAADEGEAHLVRRLQNAASELGKAQKAFNQLFDRPALVEEPPDIGLVCQDWRRSLIDLFEVRTHLPGAAEEALRREVLRLPPARATYDSKSNEDGATGARDALIWLTILADLKERKENGHFISANKDFMRNGGLRDELVREVPDGFQITGYTSAFKFLDVLGQHEPKVELTLDELARRAMPVLRAVLPPSLVLAKAVFGSGSRDWSYDSSISEIEPIRVKGARRWVGTEESLTVVDSEWRMVVSSARFPQFSDGAPEIEEDIPVSGTVQLYLPDTTDEELHAQVVSTRLVREGDPRTDY